MSTDVVVAEYPKCDFCNNRARYDARCEITYLEMRGGMWGYMCEDHFQKLTSGKLGTGFGQKLILRFKPKKEE